MKLPENKETKALDIINKITAIRDKVRQIIEIYGIVHSICRKKSNNLGFKMPESK